MKLNFNFSGKTLLKDWWKIVRDNFTAIQTDHNTLSDKLDTEITQRTNADVGLADKITAETKARESEYSSLSSRINNEVTIRQAADNELQRNIDSEITERQTADSKKADKTELYGTDETTKHTITHTLTTSDFVINITPYDTGTVKIPAETVHSKILLNGSPMPAVDLIGTFNCSKSEEDHGDKYVAIAYSPNTGKLDIDVVDIDCAPTDADAIAEINIQYQRAEITKMYHLSHIFYGISSLNDLKTNNKNSFLAAVNEIATKLTTEISDREGAEHSLNEKISTEISDRQAADNELKAKIADINSELTTDNLFYDLSKYVNSDNKLVTDDSGVQYLSYSGTFDVVYLYHNFVVDNFRRKPKTKTTLELTFNVASRHIAGGGCDSGGLNRGETDVLITYTDTTTERFGQSYYTATDTGDKTITINGTSETYKTTKFKIEIPVKKEIKSISFRIVSDNFYTNGDPTGNVCEQETLIQSAVCYDDECVVARKELDDFVQVIETALDGKAPTNHASNGTGFGKGTRTAFGHVKLSEVINSSTGADAGIAVAPKAVKTAYDKAVSAYELADGKLDANFVSNGYAGIDEVTTTLSDMWRDRVAPPTTITVACSTSKHNITADYHCNGTNDQTVIQQAIDALPSTGGKIVLLEGTYNISGQITVNQPNVTICGMGNNTILKAAKSSSTLTMLRCSNHSGFKISNLVMDFENNSSAQCIGIQLYVSGHSTIENISILNNKGNGIEWYKCDYTRFNGVSFVNVRQCIWDRGYNHSSIFSGVIIDTATNGIVLETNSELNQIDGCIVRYATGKGISSDSAYTMINDNIVYGCGVGITANGNCSTVSGNNACDNDTGISINGKMINVSGNTAVRTDGSGNVSSYSSSQYTILLGSSSKNCFVTCNLITGKNYTNNGNSTHTITNNKY